MNEFFSDIRIQQSLALFLIALTFVTFVAGAIIKKTNLFDPKGKAGPSRSIGKFMMIFSAILCFTAIMAFSLSLFED